MRLRLCAAFVLLSLVAAASSAEESDLRGRIKRLEQRLRELQAQIKKHAEPPVTAGERIIPENAQLPCAAPLAASDRTSAVDSGGDGAVAANGKNPWLWSLYFDGYIGHNFNRPVKRVNQVRNFDVSSDQFNLNYSEFVIEHAAEPFGFRADVGFGQAADIVHASTSAEPNAFRHLEQAYVSYKAPIGNGLVMDVGKFVTSAGAEVIESGSNWNYSRSLLFTYAIPYYHFGLRATYAMSPQLAFGAQIVNGWNNVTDNKAAKTYVGTAAWTPVKTLSIAETAITGPEPNDSSRGWRTLSDTVLHLTATNKLAFLFNYDYATDRPDGVKRVKWSGVAGAARYSVTNWLAFAPRLEWFDDRDGFTTGTAQHVKEATMTGEVKLHDGLLWRVEYRRDWTQQPFFDRGPRPASARQQTTIAAALIFVYSPAR